MRSLYLALFVCLVVACSDDEIPTIGPPITTQGVATEPPSQNVMCAELDAGAHEDAIANADADSDQ